MDTQTKKKLGIAGSICAFILLFIMTCSPSEERQLEKHGGEFIRSEFEEVDWAKPDEDVIGRNISRELARDVDSLRNYTMTPQEKYNLDDMYCTAAAMYALRDAQNRMDAPNQGVNVFYNAKKDYMTNGNNLCNYMRNTYENEVPGSIVVIRNPHDMKIKKIERQFKKFNPGTTVRYCGHYKSGDQYRHTQTYLGTGYCTEDDFVPNRHGRVVMGAAYNNAFKSLHGDFENKFSPTCEYGRPAIDSILLIDQAAIMSYLAKQKSN